MSRFYLLVAALGLVVVGCETQKPSVSGTVSFQGQPLPSGTVHFHGADGRDEHSLIAADGTYTVTNAPIGIVRITVQSHGAAPPKMPSSGGKAPTPPPEIAPRTEDRRDTKYMPIPPRYKDPEKSGLTYTVSAGTQTHNIELQP